jgi:hypothetical protein
MDDDLKFPSEWDEADVNEYCFCFTVLSHLISSTAMGDQNSHSAKTDHLPLEPCIPPGTTIH